MKKETRYTVAATAQTLELQGAGKPRVPGEIVMVTTDAGLMMGNIKTVETYRPALELFLLPKPMKDGKHTVTHLIIFHKIDAAGKRISTPVALVPQGADPDKALAFANQCLKKYQQKLGIKRVITDAHWRTLGDLWKSTVHAMNNSGDVQAEYEAEKSILTDTVTGEMTEKVASAIKRAQRKARKLDRVKVELSTGWWARKYREMRGPELVSAIHAATGIKLPIKTIRSLCNWLDLTSDNEKVKSGPKERDRIETGL